MRPVVLKVGTCTTAAPAMLGPGGATSFDTSQLREKSVQLVNLDGNWKAGTVALQASLDGVTWATVTTVGSPGLYGLPPHVVGRLRALADSLSASVSVDVWVAGLDSRTE